MVVYTYIEFIETYIEHLFHRKPLTSTFDFSSRTLTEEPEELGESADEQQKINQVVVGDWIVVNNPCGNRTQKFVGQVYEVDDSSFEVGLRIIAFIFPYKGYSLFPTGYLPEEDD